MNEKNSLNKKNFFSSQNIPSDTQSSNSSTLNGKMINIQAENASLQKDIEKKGENIKYLLSQIASYKNEIIEIKNKLNQLKKNDIIENNEELSKLELERLQIILNKEKETNKQLKNYNKSILSHNKEMKTNYKMYTGKDFS